MRNQTSLLYRQLTKSYPIAATGQGAYIVDADGHRYIDACGGAAVSSVGHNHPAVMAALRRQIDAIDYIHTSFFTSEATEQLADELVSSAPSGMSHVMPFSGGSEAIESALKLARQAAVERGQDARRVVISRHQSYHGNTMGALSISGNLGRRALYDPLLFRAEFIEPCFHFRYAQPGESEEDYARRSAAALERKILELGPESVLAFVAETVAGATAGAVVPSPGYFRQIREICDRYGCFLILDEVMCGMGRTGTLHACEQESVSPDIMVVAKGLGGGVAPIAAVYIGDSVYDAIATGSGALQNGFTYMGHPLSCAAALAVQQVIRQERLLENVRQQGARLRSGLESVLGAHKHVGDIRGRGLFLAVEFVRDRNSLEPFDAALKIHEAVKREAMAAELLVYAMPGTIDGTRGNHIMLAPPYTVDAAIVDEIVGRLASAVDRALSRL
jgi:adenosylmethionine-8-amino-7-oxononanoate aminotransferase